MCPSILLIEDDSGLASSLKKELEAEGYAVNPVSRGDQGLACAQTEAYDVVITEFRLPGPSGLEIIRQLHTFKPRLPVILIAPYGSTDTAIEACKLGAFDYLAKPFEMPELLAQVAKAVECNNQPGDVVTITPTSSPASFVGDSRGMAPVLKGIGHAAVTSMMRIPMQFGQRSDFSRTVIRFKSDAVPMQIGQRSGE